MQIELPSEVRKELFNNPNFMKTFTEIFDECYFKVIIPWYESHKKHQKHFESEKGENFEITIDSPEKAKECVQKMWERDNKYSNKQE